MNTKLAHYLFWTLVMIGFIALTLKVGFIMGSLITFILAVLIPREVYIVLVALIAFSINLAFLEFLFRYWPITLIVCIVALLGYLTEKDSETKSKQGTSCKRIS